MIDKRNLMARGMAFAMIGFMGFSGMSVTAYATGETTPTETEATLPTPTAENPIPQTEENENMGYDVKGNGFNVYGMDGEKQVSTTCGNGGYRTYEAVQSGDTVPTRPDSTINGTGSFKYGDNYSDIITQDDTGTTDTNEEESITTAVTADVDGTSTTVTYYVKNGTKTEQIVWIGSSADTQIGKIDSAPVSYTDDTKTALIMEGDGYRFELKSADDSHPFTTLWYGGYSSASQNVFNTRTGEDALDTYRQDSGIAYSWKIVIPAGKTYSRSALFTLLKQIAPSIPSLPPIEEGPIEVVETTDPEVTQPQLVVVSTDAGAALPTTELGEAPVPTKTISLDMSKFTPAQYKEAVISTIQNVGAGGNLVIETNEVSCFDAAMIETLASRNDISVNVVFKYNGQKILVVIPAGYNVKDLLDENGYCGFLRLADRLGFTVIG